MYHISHISSYLHLKILLRLSVGGLSPRHEFNLLLVAMWELVCSDFLYHHQLKTQIYTLIDFLKFNEEERKIRMDCSSNNFLMTLNNVWTQILPVCDYTPVNTIWKNKYVNTYSWIFWNNQIIFWNNQIRLRIIGYVVDSIIFY